MSVDAYLDAAGKPRRHTTLKHGQVTMQFILFVEELLELHRGQGMDIYWRDSFTCPTEEEYKEMVRKSRWNGFETM